MTINRFGIMLEENAHAAASATRLILIPARHILPDNHWLVRKLRYLTSQAKHEAGFTLVEVIVALAILSIGLSVLLGLLSGGLQQTARAERLAEAGSLAQSLMAEVGTDLPIKAEARDGEFPSGYRWHLTMLPYGNAKEREEWPIGLYLVSTEVEWEERAQRRSYGLSTLRVGPKAPSR